MACGNKFSTGRLFAGLMLATAVFCGSAAARQDALACLREALRVDSLLVFSSDTVLKGQPPAGAETVVFVNCNGAVDRPVNGSVVILNGELGLRRAARVGGDLFLVRSTVFSSSEAELSGETISIASPEAVRVVGSTIDDRKTGGGSFPIRLNMVTNRMGGFRVEGYDRVDGFSVSWGFKMVQPDWDDFPFLSAKVISATTHQQLGFDTRLAVPLHGGRWQAWFGARSLTDTNDSWRLGSLENAIKAFVAGYDHRYYFRREGYSAGVLRKFGRRSSVSLSFLNERYSSMVNQSPFTLVGEENFEPNLPVKGGPMHSLQLTGLIDLRNDTYFTLSGTRFKFEGELAGGALGGEHGFARYDLSLERWDTFRTKHHTYLWLKVAGSDIALPFQRGYTMGGTLRGHDNFAYSGDRMALLQAAYGYSLPTLPIIEYLFLRWQADLIYETGTAFYHDDPRQDYFGLKQDAGLGFSGNTILGRLRLHLFQDLDKSFHSGRRLTLTLEMHLNE